MNRISRIEQGFLILLHVLVIAKRQSLHGGQQAHKMPIGPPGFSPDELRKIRIFFLGHDAAAGGKCVGDHNKTKLLGGPEHQFLTQTAEMHHHHRCVVEKIQNKIPVAHSVHAVPGDPVESQFFRNHFPIQIKRGTGQGRTAQGHYIDAHKAFFKPGIISV